jgi:hypothetical protein
MIEAEKDKVISSSNEKVSVDHEINSLTDVEKRKVNLGIFTGNQKSEISRLKTAISKASQKQISTNIQNNKHTRWSKLHRRRNSQIAAACRRLMHDDHNPQSRRQNIKDTHLS